jgi:hypothetical protein
VVAGRRALDQRQLVVCFKPSALHASPPLLLAFHHRSAIRRR